MRAKHNSVDLSETTESSQPFITVELHCFKAINSSSSAALAVSSEYLIALIQQAIELCGRVLITSSTLEFVPELQNQSRISYQVTTVCQCAYHSPLESEAVDAYIIDQFGELGIKAC